MTSAASSAKNFHKIAQKNDLKSNVFTLLRMLSSPYRILLVF